MSEIEGKKVPKSKAGFNAFVDAVANYFGVTKEGKTSNAYEKAINQAVKDSAAPAPAQAAPTESVVGKRVYPERNAGVADGYKTAKSSLPNHTPIFRIGDFFEFFGDEAGLTGAAVTKRGDMRMSAVPYYAVGQLQEIANTTGKPIAVISQGVVTEEITPASVAPTEPAATSVISDILADVPLGYPLDRETARLVSAAVVRPGGLLSAMAANPVVALRFSRRPAGRARTPCAACDRGAASVASA
jgi:hypothetical protein